MTLLQLEHDINLTSVPSVHLDLSLTSLEYPLMILESMCPRYSVGRASNRCIKEKKSVHSVEEVSRLTSDYSHPMLRYPSIFGYAIRSRQTPIDQFIVPEAVACPPSQPRPPPDIITYKSMLTTSLLLSHQIRSDQIRSPISFPYPFQSYPQTPVSPSAFPWAFHPSCP